MAPCNVIGHVENLNKPPQNKIQLRHSDVDTEIDFFCSAQDKQIPLRHAGLGSGRLFELLPKKNAVLSLVNAFVVTRSRLGDELLHLGL